ncbi:hypothetical protein [Nesterenkonia sandarakina]|uniref:Uncharacterized protein n=1 Tax=Nesterenkonia sandarakina TaxID=272918 RepID=A0A7Z0EAP0_9MICC|nr:hypothetical protein [Nesterenkonia sandarakina]NYJ18183.1 hypothetical protein [Nesterenkonia sandarakina]
MNGLAHEGRLSPTQHQQWRTTNDWFNAAYPNPSHLDPTIYDRAINPGAVAWFKEEATHLMDRVPAYLAILASHGVACVRRTTTDPGRIVYEDESQVIAIPHQEPPMRDEVLELRQLRQSATSTRPVVRQSDRGGD